MKMILPIFFSLVLLAGCAAPARTFCQISMRNAVRLMAQEADFLLLDVRTAEEFAAGHIPGAINIPNESIGTAEPPSLPDRDRLILVYCRSGNRSKHAAQKLAALGYSNIMEIGGILDWTGPVVTGP